MSLSFAKIFPQIKNIIHKTSVNSILLTRCQSTKSRENYAALESDITRDSDQEERPPGLNMANLILEKEKMLFEPYNYNDTCRLNSARTIMLEGYNYWLKVPADMLNNCGQIMTMMYESSFMFDDMDDNSEYRRGLPVCHKIFGVPRTQISARACFPVILKKILRDFDNRKVIEIYADCLLRYWAATYLEIDWRENFVCPSVAEYRQMCIDKNVPQSGMPVQFMQLFSNYKIDVSNLVQLIALHQQWQNDCSGVMEEQMWDTKGFCDDIAEGKFTLPVIHAIQQGTAQGKMVFEIIKQKTKDVTLLKLCYSLLEESGSFEFAQKCTIAVEDEIKEEIERLGGNPVLLNYLDQINSFKNEETILTNRSNRKWTQI